MKSKIHNEAGTRSIVLLPISPSVPQNIDLFRTGCGARRSTLVGRTILASGQGAGDHARMPKKYFKWLQNT